MGKDVKDLLFISQDKEMALIQEMTYKIKMSEWSIHPSKTCFLCVSPDYSGIVTQHLSHSLSMDRECFHVEAVNVPFPDEPVEEYQNTFRENIKKWGQEWDNFVLCEAGVIRGGNYTWTTNIMKEYGLRYYTLSLCENVYSRYQSDMVSLYYDNERFDLHFWWERPNNHWEFYTKEPINYFNSMSEGLETWHSQEGRYADPQ